MTCRIIPQNFKHLILVVHGIQFQNKLNAVRTFGPDVTKNNCCCKISHRERHSMVIMLASLSIYIEKKKFRKSV